MILSEQQQISLGHEMYTSYSTQYIYFYVYLEAVKRHVKDRYGGHFRSTRDIWIIEFSDPKLQTLFLIQHP